jgi:competence protein ComEA
MGTRQEWGLVVLVLLLAAPALWPRHEPTAAVDLPRCAHPQLIAGAGAVARLRCLETAAPERGPLPGLVRLLLGRGLDPNTASAAELEMLPRIGPVLAQRIVAHRRSVGPFERLEQLERVRGIGPKTLARIRPYLALAAAAAAD